MGCLSSMDKIVTLMLQCPWWALQGNILKCLEPRAKLHGKLNVHDLISQWEEEGICIQTVEH